MGDDRRVIVIGSGPSGAMAARELVDRGVPVTLLEAGDKLQRGILVRVAGRNLFRRMPPLHESQEHVISGDPVTRWRYNIAPGGLSNNWTGAVPRFAPEDFTEGERLHERYRWPVTYDDLAPYYDRVERLLQITADSRAVPNLPPGYAAYQHRLADDWLAIDRLANEHGQGLTTLPLADGPPLLMAPQGTAFNSFVRIVRPLLRSPHFTLVTRAHVLRLEWSPSRRRVDAVIYHDRSTGQERRLSADAVVVACGALHSTKLLFDSSCPDFPEGLGNADGVLGSFLHDHPREWWAFDTDRPLTLLSPPAYLTRLPYARSTPLLATSWTLGIVGTRDRIMSRFGGKGCSVGVQLFGTMVPDERRYAQPAAERKDEFGLPLLDLCVRYSQDEVDNMVRARQHLVDLMGEAGYRARLQDVFPTLFPGNAVHYGGTIRMHQKRQHGVLDAWNRIHDVSNVLVCDASSFPTGAEKNPTLTVMALAARAAARLADDLKTGPTYAA